MALRAGVDVGGTAIKLGLVDERGERVGETSFDLDAPVVLDDVLARCASEAQSIANGGSIVGIGIGVPGLLDREARRVVQSPNLPWLEHGAVCEPLAEALGLDASMVQLENDANVAALGELALGAARDERNALIVTLGTGIGGGLVLDGALFTGAGLAGEIGHVAVDPSAGPECGCGARGCLETLASATAALRRARAAGLAGELPELAERARGGSSAERELFHAIGTDLGRGLAAPVCLLDLECFVFGGGFSAALDLLDAGIRAGVDERAFGRRASRLRLLRATLGSSAGWIGAACLTRA